MWAPLRGTLKASEILDGPHGTDGRRQTGTAGPGRLPGRLPGRPPGRLAEQLPPAPGSRRGSPHLTWEAWT